MTTSPLKIRTEESFRRQYGVRPYRLSIRHVGQILRSGRAEPEAFEAVRQEYFPREQGGFPHFLDHPGIYGAHGTPYMIVAHPYPSALNPDTEEGRQGWRFLGQVRDLGIDVLVLPPDRSFYHAGTLHVRITGLGYWRKPDRQSLRADNPTALAVARDQVQTFYSKETKNIAIAADRVVAPLPKTATGTRRDLHLRYDGEISLHGLHDGPGWRLDKWNFAAFRQLDTMSHLFTNDPTSRDDDTVRRRVAAAVLARDVILDYQDVPTP